MADQEKLDKNDLHERVIKLMGPPPAEATFGEAEDERREIVEEAVNQDALPGTPGFSEKTDVLSEPEEDEVTADAVDDIVAEESDEILAVEDAFAQQDQIEPPKRASGGKLKRFFQSWWDHPLARWLTIFAIVFGIAAAGIVPMARYTILNAVGVRVTSSVTILDEISQQPLKNVRVELSGVSATTDSEGLAKLSGLRQGKTDLIISKRAYADYKQSVTLGWGSNPLSTISLKAVGTQYTLLVKDFLSGKSITGAEAVSGEADGAADNDGTILLSIDPQDASTTKATVTAPGYRPEVVILNQPIVGGIPVAMVLARPSVYISKRSGTYDVYRVDIDGKNDAVVLKGTGLEQDTMSLAVHDTADEAAFVSTRENVHNTDGFLLQTLTLLNIKDKTSNKIVQSEQIKLLGWIGDKIIYLQVAAGASAGNAQRYRLMSFDYKTSEKKEIAAANYFNDARVEGSKIYYATSNFYQANAENWGLYVSSADGKNKSTLWSDEVWTVSRSSYDKLVFSTSSSEWYEHTIGGSTVNKLASGQPANLVNRVYTENSDRSQAAWIDERDGKGTLLVTHAAGGADAQLVAQNGLVLPVRWLDVTTLVYRVKTGQESADYAISTSGGEAKKITDVTNVPSR